MFCYCAESRRVARLLTARYDAALAGSGLSASQFEVLDNLAGLEGASGRALAEQLAVDKTTLSRNLKALITAGLVRVQADGDDARQAMYTLTAKGRVRLAKTKPLWQRAHDATVQMLQAKSSATQKSLLGMSAALRA